MKHLTSLGVRQYRVCDASACESQTHWEIFGRRIAFGFSLRDLPVNFGKVVYMLFVECVPASLHCLAHSTPVITSLLHNNNRVWLEPIVFPKVRKRAMNRKFVSGVLLFTSVVLIAPEKAASFQNVAQVKPPAGFATSPKAVSAHLKLADGSNYVARGLATFTITLANENDTLTGTLVYTMPDDARKKIAESHGKALSNIPASVRLKDAIASFERGTSCPQIKLAVATKDTEIGGVKLHFDRVVLNINETPEQLNQLFCSWTRQINVKRQRLGIIAATNRLLAPPDAAEEAVENKPVKP